ncbi:MAG TPA: uroporphyrinogen-III synthase [Gaiellaceae bacterium]|nr:uroporphyrinogen-III synthase [Gaiellaceae bacterium]
MRVVLTRRAGANDRLAQRLREEGFDVAEAPLIRVEPLPGPPLRVEGYDWLVVTSRAGVAELFRRLAGPLPRVAAIGPGTAEALRERGVEPALVARDSTQEGLARELPSPAGRVLFAGAEGARDVLVRELAADFLPLYRTVPLRPAAFPAGDVVVVASASAARALAEAAPGRACVSIGPVTSRAARERGLRVAAEATTPDVEGLVRAVKLAASRAASSPS